MELSRKYVPTFPSSLKNFQVVGHFGPATAVIMHELKMNGNLFGWFIVTMQQKVGKSVYFHLNGATFVKKEQICGSSSIMWDASMGKLTKSTQTAYSATDSSMVLFIGLDY